MCGSTSFSNGSDLYEIKLEQKLKARACCVSKWPISPWLLLPIVFSLLTCTYDLLVTRWWRKKKLRPSLHMILPIGRSHLRVDSWKKNVQGKHDNPTQRWPWRTVSQYFQCRELWAGTQLFILLGRRCVQKYKSTLIHGPWLIFSWKIRDLEETWLKNWWQGDLGERQIDRPLQLGLAYDDICVLHECSPKSKLDRGIFDN